tara:strand:+ start:2233 stop:3312 length:1080 start_codon:yes stop_codon:yes gene_type:complete
MQIKLKFIRSKRIYIFFCTVILFLTFFSTTFSYSKTFKVNDIEISQSFDLNFSKNKVVDKGFRLAFLNLISMITTSGDKKKISNTSLNEIKGMIDSFTISDEKFIDNQYFANLDVTFNKKNTLFFLEKKNIFPSIPIKNNLLLIPIIIDLETNSIFLFSKNDFYKKWNDHKKNYYLLKYFLPSEDIDDLRNIQKNFENIENYDFKELIKKYDLEDYIVSIIFKKQNELRVLSRINLNNTLRLNNKIFLDINLNNEKNFNFVMQELKEIYEDFWKKSNEINTSVKLPLTISVESNKYKKIEKLENTLNNLDLVADFFIIKFNNKNSLYRIIYNGSPINFLNDMKKENFDFITEKNIWVLK